MRPAHLAVLLAASVVGACDLGGSPVPTEPAVPSGITVTPAGAGFAPSDPIVLRVVNSSDREYTFNTCFWSLQRELAGRWRSVQGAEICNANARRLPPGSSVNATYSPVRDLLPGRYRIAARFAAAAVAGPSRYVQVSDPFAVVE